VVRRVQVPVLLSVMQDRQLLAMFTQHLASKLANYQAVISDFVTNNSEQRLASTILRLAKSLGTHDSGMIRVRERISYQDLSEMVGTTRSRVGFFMSEFSKLGMIKDSGDFSLVINPGLITQYLEQNGRLKGE
jgi:CRP/FNR family cyclic AMP-dependent transcriptional regulator